MPRIETKFGPIHVSESGRGSPLLLLPANPGTHRDFDAIVPELSRHHRVLAVDWPGFGESPPPDPPSSASAMYFAEVAAALVESLDLTDLRVIGNSVGGYAAVRLALLHPARVSALVLANTGGFTRPTLVARAFTALKGRESVTRVIATHFASRYLHVKNDFARAVLERTEAGRKNPASVAVDAAVWRSFRAPEHDLREVARGVAVPTLVAWGKFDPVVPLRSDGMAAHRAIPGSELAVFDAGHMAFVETPRAFLDAVVPFLARARGVDNAA